MKNFKDMSLEELQAFESEVKKEIASRQAKRELVLYTHECKNGSNHHLGKYKHWAKTGVRR